MITSKSIGRNRSTALHFKGAPLAQAQALSQRRFSNERDVELYFVPDFLSMLGYRYPRDIRNVPALDSPDYRVGSRRKTAIYPDHLVLANGSIVFVLDAKGPAQKLEDHIDQALSYALHPDVQAEISVLTNGRHTLVVHTRRRDIILAVKQREIPVMLPELKLLLGRKSLAGRVGDLIIERKLGRGSFGTVYLAWNVSLRRYEAVKIYHPEVIASEASRKRLSRGLREQAKLRHESIAGVYHWYNRNAEMIVSMQYSSGVTFDRWARSESSVRKKISLLSQVARAIHFAHTQGVVHRDLKPSNILVEEFNGSWKPLIVDFDTAVAPDSSWLTRTAESIGTLGFMAPEMYPDRQPSRLGKRSHRVDIYALGALAYFSLFASTPGAQADSRRIDDLLKRRRMDLETSQARKLITTILKATDRDPAMRHTTAELLANDLEESLSEAPAMPLITEQEFVDALFAEIDKLSLQTPIYSLTLELYDDNDQVGRVATIQGVGEAIIMYDFDYRELMAGFSFPKARQFNSFLKRPDLVKLRRAFGNDLIVDQPSSRANGGVYIFWRLSQIMGKDSKVVATRAFETLRKFWSLLDGSLPGEISR